MDRRFEFVRTEASRILLGDAIEQQLAAAVDELRPDGIVVVHDDALVPMAQRIAKALGARGTLSVASGGTCKRLESVGQLATSLGRLGATRGTVLVAIGGGTILDLAGFLASIYLRGVPLVVCPTTTLAMCDAALGGKNGVDHDGLKNRLGTIQQPALVFADIGWLQSLSSEQFREGIVEAIKKAAVLDASCFARLESLAPALAVRDSRATQEAIEMAMTMKMNVVVADEREAGLRATLNFGHTIGHAIESLANGSLRHGQAVAMGMLAECRAASNVAAPEATGRIAALLRRLGIDPSVPAHLADAPALWRIAQQDKKARSGRVPMVVPTVIGTRATVELDAAGLERALA
jgi:3-dehydroquinate synthase